ncbi:hypothetical protein GOB57_08025 [Sinorhizobium meliloti]|nr:hypothetical protein [Sinorhizobium meliloti]
MPRLEFRRIKSAEDFADIFRLRYRAYVANELIEPNEKGMSIDNYDLLENCQIFGLYLDGKLSSSLRIHHVNSDTPWCPAVKSFGEYLLPELKKGNSFVDGSRFCVEPTRAPELSALPFLTVRFAYMASVHFSSTYNISVVRSEHAAFYRRYYGFERWAGGVNLDWYKLPVDLYVGDMRVNRSRIDERLPFMQSNFEERLMLFSDELPHQGIRSVKGLFGNTATNSIRENPPGSQLRDWLASSVG